jgi:Asp-tRNA(Asn)/Glu-tRNA(Gln) amidotransferase B subunit
LAGRDARLIRLASPGQDTAKTSTSPSGETLIDFNRAGIGLMEVVTEADITLVSNDSYSSRARQSTDEDLIPGPRSAEEAALFVRTLRGILRRIGASDADMDKVSFNTVRFVSLLLAAADLLSPPRVPSVWTAISLSTDPTPHAGLAQRSRI